MFISKKDLDNLKEELRIEFTNKLNETATGWAANLQETLKEWELKPRPKTKKSVE